MSELANMLALQAQIGLAPVKHAVARVALRLVSNLPTNYFANERYTQRDHTHTHTLSLSLSVSLCLAHALPMHTVYQPINQRVWGVSAMNLQNAAVKIHSTVSLKRALCHCI
jgi:hypothetical protein